MRIRLALLLVVIGCGTPAGVPATARAPAPPPPGLLATVSLGNDAALRPLRAFLEEVKPGPQQALSGPAVTPHLAKAVGARSLDGLDSNSPRYVLWFDDGAAKGFAVVAKFSNAAALAANLGDATSVPKGDWAVVGKPAVLAKIGRYALDEFARGSTNSQPSISVYVPHVLTRYRNEIEAARKQISENFKAVPNGAQMGPLLDGYVTGLLSMLQDSEQAVVTFETDGKLGGLDLVLVPRANTRLATFVSLQKPAEFGLLQKLTASPWMVFGGGHFEAGPYRQGLIEMTAAMYSQADGHAMMALVNAMLAASTGDFAFGGQLSIGKGMEILQLFPVTSADAITSAVDKFTAWLGNGKTLLQMNMKTTLVPAKPSPIGGAQIRGYDMTYDASAIPEQQRAAMKIILPNGLGVRLAMVDKLAVVAMSNNPTVGITSGIAAASGKAPGFAATGQAAGLLGSARGHKDSLAFVIDVGVVTGRSALPFMMSLGFSGSQAHFRVTVPSSVLKLVVQ